MRPPESRTASPTSLTANENLPLRRTKVVVVGAGPGGLSAAIEARRKGAQVIVFEKAGDPNGSDPGYTDRSFNFTLNDVGRAVLHDERAWEGGVRTQGRAVHNYQNTHTTYYTHEDSYLISISRPQFRQNLAKIAGESGVSLEFDTTVTQVDKDHGEVVFTKGNKMWVEPADLIVMADGTHSIMNKLERETPGGEVKLSDDPSSYVTATLSPEVCQKNDISLHHLHFWHTEGKDSYVIGLPNSDGSLSILFISKFSDIEPNEHPFKTPEEAKHRLENDFPDLLQLDPDLPNQLPQRSRGLFHYKTINDFALGEHVAAIGDAAVTFPPWAGFGANNAIYMGWYLINALASHDGDVRATLADYQRYSSILSQKLQQYVLDHGEFLSDRVQYEPDARGEPELSGIIDEISRELNNANQ